MNFKIYITFITNFIFIHLFSQEQLLLFRKESDNIYLYKKAILSYIKKYKTDTLYYSGNDELFLPNTISKCLMLKIDSNISKRNKKISFPKLIHIKPIEIKRGEIIISILNFDYSDLDKEISYNFAYTIDYIFIYNLKNKKYKLVKEKIYYY